MGYGRDTCWNGLVWPTGGYRLMQQRSAERVVSLFTFISGVLAFCNEVCERFSCRYEVSCDSVREIDDAREKKRDRERRHGRSYRPRRDESEEEESDDDNARRYSNAKQRESVSVNHKQWDSAARNDRGGNPRHRNFVSVDSDDGMSRRSGTDWN